MKKVLLLLGVFFAVVAMAQDKIYVYFSDYTYESYDVNKMDSIYLDNQEGILSGKFSVSAKQQVRFSQGNLQYQASTNTWRFAENQYDALGIANEQISSTDTEWIDLFGFGTSGYKGKYPYMTSKKSEDYGDGKNDITGTNYDWGVYNKIANGGAIGKWHTLTYREWNYILNERINAEFYKSQASVCGVHGCLLLPDDFECPLGITFTPKSGDYTTNNYNKSQWQSLEAAGAVFLPSAGRRKVSDVERVGSYGYYWSSSIWYFLCFYSGKIALDYDELYYGCSVRLVTE